MTKFFLASRAALLIEAARPLFAKPLTAVRLAVVPTAANIYDHKPWYDEEIDALRKAGLTLVDIDVEGKTEAELRKAFVDIDGIFVSGGNTYHLLYHARKSGFDVIAKELVAKGIVYIGSSAGAVLAGTTIDIARRIDNPDVVKLEDFTGLALVDYCVLPHIGELQYQEKIDKIIAEWQDKPCKILGLTDRQALLVLGNYFELIDTGT